MWRGKGHTVPANRMFGAIEAVEAYITRTQIIEAITLGTTPYSKVSRAWAAALRYAGAPVTAEQAYAELSKKEPVENPLDEPMVAVSLALLSLMLMPRELEKFMDRLGQVMRGESLETAPAVATEAGKTEPIATTSPKRRIKSQSVTGESPHQSSGT